MMHSLLIYGSIALSLAVIIGIYMTAHKIRFGWLYMAAVQVPGAIYDYLTHQYGLISLSAVSMYLYWRGWQKH